MRHGGTPMYYTTTANLYSWDYYFIFFFDSLKKSIDRQGSSETRSITKYLIAMLTAQKGTIIKRYQRVRVFIYKMTLQSENIHSPYTQNMTLEVRAHDKRRFQPRTSIHLEIRG